MRWGRMLRVNPRMPPCRSTEEKILQMPTLVWLHPHLGLTAADLLAAISMAGAATSLMMAAGYNSMLVALATFLLYLSLFAVGQTFLSFQWDILLLEAGWAAVLMAPLPGEAPEHTGMGPPRQCSSTGAALSWSARSAKLPLPPSPPLRAQASWALGCAARRCPRRCCCCAGCCSS
jgi:hypothetical protein